MSRTDHFPRALLALLARLACGCLPLASVPAAYAERPPIELRIGVEGAYPPFSEVGPDGELRGFDIDIAHALCAQMHARCTLVQQNFDGMIPALNGGKIDAVIASLSITDERRKAVNFTDKYYKTPGRLVARKNAALQASAAGLAGRRIGVQRASSYDRFASDTFTQSEIVRYGKQDEVFLDLASGRIDAALCDSVAAYVGFLRQGNGSDFAFVGPAFLDQRYFGYGAGIALRKGDEPLRLALNGAIAAIRADGTYARIQANYVDFDLYADATSTLAPVGRTSLLHGYGGSLLTGAVLTLELALASLLLAAFLGCLGTAAKLSNSRVLRGFAHAYTTVVRAVPDLVLMLLVFYGGQALVDHLVQRFGAAQRIDINPFVAGVATIGVVFGAYLTETFRGAYLCVPPGQREAAVAFGMSSGQALRRIVGPQMLRHALPPLLNNWLVLLKSTAIVSVIGLTDMMQRAGLAAGATHQPFLFYAAVALIYLALTGASEAGFGWLSRRLATGTREVSA